MVVEPQNIDPIGDVLTYINPTKGIKPTKGQVHSNPNRLTTVLSKLGSQAQYHGPNGWGKMPPHMKIQQQKHQKKKHNTKKVTTH